MRPSAPPQKIHRTPKSATTTTMKHHKGPNRKAVSNVIRNNRKGPRFDAKGRPITDSDDSASITSEEENPLHDRLESCTVEELQKLKESAFHFDEEKYPQHRIEVVAEEIKGMGRREPIRFTEPVVMLTGQEIVAKFDAFFTLEPDARNKDPLLLNLSKDQEKDRPLYTKLRQWDQYEVIGDVFEPVHLALFDHQKKRHVAPPTHINTLARLQNALIVSHYQETTFKTAHLIEQLEHQLYSKLLEIYVNKRTATFMLEWNQYSAFVLIVCFGVVAPTGGASHNNGIGDDDDDEELLTLSRDDLLNDIAGDTPSIFTKREKTKQVEEYEQKNNKQKKKGKGGAPVDMNRRREFLRACKLSYLYYGYMARG